MIQSDLSDLSDLSDHGKKLPGQMPLAKAQISTQARPL